MEIISTRIQNRDTVNTARIFTEQHNDDAYNYFRGYKLAEQIKYFYIKASNRLTSKALKVIAPVFPNLQVLELDNFWNLDYKATLIISQFKELKELSLGPSSVEYDAFNNLFMLPKLEKLKINKCVSLNSLSSSQTLHTLFVKKCPNLSPTVHELLNKQNFPSLKNLGLTHLQISDDQFATICSNLSEQLEVLCVSRCKQLTGKGMINVSKMQKLRRFEGRELLKLFDCEIDWPLSLQEIDLRKCRNVGNLICKFLKNNKMEKIDFEESGIGDDGLNNLLENCWEKLKCLRIKSCDKISTDMKHLITKNCSMLQELSVSRIDSKLFSKLRVENLLTLRVYDSNLSHSDYKRLFEKASDLKELKLLNSNVDDVTLKMLGTHCKSLVTLGIGDKQITEKGAYFIRRLHPNLKYLNVSGCSSLSEEGLSKMLEEARFNKFKAYGCSLLGPSTFDVLEEKCGYYLLKIECVLVGGITKNPTKPTFYLSLLRTLKVNLYSDGRFLQSISKLKRLRKVVFLDTQCEQEDLVLLKESTSIEHFEARNGSIVRLCENPTFLREWGEGLIKDTLRFLVLPHSSFSEKCLSVCNKFPNLVNLDKNNTCILKQLKYNAKFFGEKRDLKIETQFCPLSPNISLEGKTAVVMRANYELQTELVKQLDSSGCKVYAFFEEKEMSEKFKDLHEKIQEENLSERIVAIPYIPSDKESLHNALREAVENHNLERVDFLFMGILGVRSNSKGVDNILQTFYPSFITENLPDMLFADLFVFQAFEDLVNKSRETKVVVLSNRISSISDNFSSRRYSQRIFGTAIHQLSKNVSIEWQRKSEANVFLVSLGQIHTGSFRNSGTLNSLSQSASVGATRVLDILSSAKPEYSGKMIDFNLKIINS